MPKAKTVITVHCEGDGCSDSPTSKVSPTGVSPTQNPSATSKKILVSTTIKVSCGVDGNNCQTDYPEYDEENCDYESGECKARKTTVASTVRSKKFGPAPKLGHFWRFSE